jgi:hypothetical protein
MVLRACVGLCGTDTLCFTACEQERIAVLFLLADY